MPLKTFRGRPHKPPGKLQGAHRKKRDCVKHPTPITPRTSGPANGAQVSGINLSSFFSSPAMEHSSCQPVILEIMVLNKAVIIGEPGNQVMGGLHNSR